MTHNRLGLPVDCRFEHEVVGRVAQLGTIPVANGNGHNPGGQVLQQVFKAFVGEPMNPALFEASKYGLILQEQSL